MNFYAFFLHIYTKVRILDCPRVNTSHTHHPRSFLKIIKKISPQIPTCAKLPQNLYECKENYYKIMVKNTCKKV